MVFSSGPLSSAGYLVTVHGEHAASVQAVVERIAASPDVLERGPARLMHAIVDAAVDAYFPLVDRIDDFVDGLEERIFQQFDESALRDIFSVKRLVLSLRRHLAPQREITPWVQPRVSFVMTSVSLTRPGWEFRILTLRAIEITCHVS